MKRLIAILLCAGILFAGISSLAEETENPQPGEAAEAEATQEDPEEDSAEETETGEGNPAVDAGMEILLPERLQPVCYRLTDGFVQSRVSFKSGDSLTVCLPEGNAGVLLRWYEAPGAYEVRTESDTAAIQDSILNRWIPAGSGDCIITVQSPCSLSEVSAVPEEKAGAVQDWRADGEKADVLFLLAEPGDELRCFGGLLPYLTEGCGVRVAVAYATTREKRYRAEEAMEVLWSAGIREYPAFGHFPCRNYDLLKILEEDWNSRSITAFFREEIERLRPEVIVTNGPDGTVLPTRTIANRCALEAAEQAGWETKKVYVQEGAFDGCRFPEETRLEELDGRSPMERALELYGLYASLQTYSSGLVPCSALTLRKTSVGNDRQGNSVFENIKSGQLTSYHEPKASTPAVPPPPPSPAPADEPMPAGTMEDPLQEPDSENPDLPPAPISAGTAGERKLLLPVGWLMIGGGALLSLVLVTVLAGLLKRRRGRTAAVIFGMLPVAAAVVFVLWRGMQWDTTLAADDYRAPLPAEQPEQIATPVPTATPAPTPEPTATPAPVAEDSSVSLYFRQAGEPAETILVDQENEHWEYRTDTLDIRINGYHTTFDNYPLAYYVADIRMKSIYEFRPVFGTEGHTGRGREYPWIMARKSKAVLWITGDNMINDERDEKGVLIRDGIVFSKLENEDTLAMYPDMTLRIFPKFNADAAFLLEDGVENTFSFGPTLVRDGELNPKAVKHRIHRSNPRTGIGMIEPGHWIAIVVDGRQRDTGYSNGLKIEDFAQLFIDYGCVTAYNLDGGLSAAMLFMGEQINSHGNRRIGTDDELSYQRSVPDGLAFGYSEQTPTVDDPIYNNGNVEKTRG